jgi:hypothetical protein
MSTAKKIATNQASIYLPEDTHKKLKIAAVERGKPFNSVVCEALASWWEEQPEGKRGPLFPEESSTTPGALSAAKALLEKPAPVVGAKAASTKRAAPKKATRNAKPKGTKASA